MIKSCSFEIRGIETAIVVSATSYGNDPVNWIAATPNAGTSGLADTDGDGMADAWEEANGLNKLVNDDNAAGNATRFYRLVTPAMP